MHIKVIILKWLKIKSQVGNELLNGIYTLINNESLIFLKYVSK